LSGAKSAGYNRRFRREGGREREREREKEREREREREREKERERERERERTRRNLSTYAIIIVVLSWMGMQQGSKVTIKIVTLYALEG